MHIELKKLPDLGKWDKKYKVWRQTIEEERRSDIDPKKMYIVTYHGIWLIGRFVMNTSYNAWNFHPNMGSMTMQIEWLEKIYEVVRGLDQKKAGSTASHILEYLAEEE